jgi:hypothetical protein
MCRVMPLGRNPLDPVASSRFVMKRPSVRRFFDCGESGCAGQPRREIDPQRVAGDGASRVGPCAVRTVEALRQFDLVPAILHAVATTLSEPMGLAWIRASSSSDYVADRSTARGQRRFNLCT